MHILTNNHKVNTYVTTTVLKKLNIADSQDIPHTSFCLEVIKPITLW